MNSQPEQDVDRRLEQLETELNSPRSTLPVSQSQTSERIQKDTSIQPQLKVFNWFNSLPSWGKLTVIGVGAIVGIAILRAVLSLVAAVISLSVLGVILYLAYQFFIARSTNE